MILKENLKKKLILGYGEDISFQFFSYLGQTIILWKEFEKNIV